MQRDLNRRREKPRFVMLFLLLTYFLNGCASVKVDRLFLQQSANARELYCEPGFRWQSLEEGGITFLAARVNTGQETYGPSLAQGLVDSMQTSLSAQKIVHPNLAVNRVSKAGLARTYATMLTEHGKTNILPRMMLRKVGQAVHAQYFALPILISFREDQSSRLTAFGLQAARTASATARLQLQIWDSEAGRIVWEGRSDVTLAREMLREGPIRFDEIIQIAWAQLLQQIPANETTPAFFDEETSSFASSSQEKEHTHDGFNFSFHRTAKFLLRFLPR
jgi:PBP1b-binding outer membrane lipoprotein LpoB